MPRYKHASSFVHEPISHTQSPSRELDSPCVFPHPLRPATAAVAEVPTVRRTSLSSDLGSKVAADIHTATLTTGHPGRMYIHAHQTPRILEAGEGKETGKSKRALFASPLPLSIPAHRDATARRGRGKNKANLQNAERGNNSIGSGWDGQRRDSERSGGES
jgi:hypothetical protein